MSNKSWGKIIYRASESRNCECVFSIRLRHSLQSPIPEIRAQCSDYRFFTSTTWCLPDASPTRIQEVLELGIKHTHTHTQSTGLQTRIPKSNVLHNLVNGQEPQLHRQPYGRSSGTPSQITQLHRSTTLLHF